MGRSLELHGRSRVSKTRGWQTPHTHICPCPIRRYQPPPTRHTTHAPPPCSSFYSHIRHGDPALKGRASHPPTTTTTQGARRRRGGGRQMACWGGRGGAGDCCCCTSSLVHVAGALLLLSQLEVLGALDDQLLLGLALLALQAQRDLLRRLRLSSPRRHPSTRVRHWTTR